MNASETTIQNNHFLASCSCLNPVSRAGTNKSPVKSDFSQNFPFAVEITFNKTPNPPERNSFLSRLINSVFFLPRGQHFNVGIPVIPPGF